MDSVLAWHPDNEKRQREKDKESEDEKMLKRDRKKMKKGNCFAEKEDVEKWTRRKENDEPNVLIVVSPAN